MYKISEYSNKILNTETNEVFLQDEREVSYPEYIQWLSNGGTPVCVPFFEGEQEEKNAIEMLNKETDKYIKRGNDGRDAYAKISAEFRLAKLTGQISEEAHAVVEKILIPVRNEILAGQWISGLNELTTIGTSIIGVQLYDRLHNQIQAYIDLSYTVEEINANKANNVRK